MFSLARTSHLITKAKATIRFNFSFAGPRKLDEILKLELLKDKSKSEISDIWLNYHENKENVYGSVLRGNQGLKILERSGKLPFFIQPIFRDGGYFILLSQFQSPSHFLLAFLEDFKMDPNRAQPLLTFSIFNDLVEVHDISLVRCDIINRGIEDDEGRKVVENMLDAYRLEEEYDRVLKFNTEPANFDFDEFISYTQTKWKGDIQTDIDVK